MAKDKKQLLFEVETSGLLFLTLDDHDPVYVGFQHRIKLEICLSHKPELVGEEVLMKPIHSRPEQNNVNSENQRGDKLSEPSVRDKRSASLAICEAHLQGSAMECRDLSAAMLTSGERGDSKSMLWHKKFENSVPKIVPTLSDTRKHFVPLDEPGNSKVLSPRKPTTTLPLKVKLKTNSKSTSASRKQSQTSKKLKFSSLKQTSDHRTLLTAMSDSKAGSGTELSRKTKTQNLSYEKAGKPFTCEYCLATFTSKIEFFNHRKLQSENSYLCDICHMSFPFLGYLLVHLKFHSENAEKMNFVCKQCGVRNTNLTELKKHMISHTGEHVYKCCQCSKTFAHHHNWRSHMSVHKSHGLIKCSCCYQFFETRAALSEHKMSLQEIKCGLCGQVFPNRASQMIHFKSEHEDTILRCHICQRIYSTQRELEEHIARHGRRSRKQCPICGNMVTNIHNHILIHKPIEEMAATELWICDKCPSKFRTKSSLLNHIKTNHNVGRSKCHLCLQSFKNYKGLYRHLNNVHSNLMPYQCEVCGKRCKLKSNLKVHMRSHSSAKMFPCELCDRAFNYKSSLQGHLKSKHATDEISSTRVTLPVCPNQKDSATTCTSELHSI